MRAIQNKSGLFLLPKRHRPQCQLKIIAEPGTKTNSIYFLNYFAKTKKKYTFAPSKKTNCSMV
ncbi:MAG TPA: hypothetical protein DEQ30_11090 [Porphyromonadaceae bacterium]|nr:hypothetical protein [Porphyromonadaceae bacterium]